MPEYREARAYIKEISIHAKPIEDVSSSYADFVCNTRFKPEGSTPGWLESPAHLSRGYGDIEQLNLSDSEGKLNLLRARGIGLLQKNRKAIICRASI